MEGNIKAYQWIDICVFSLENFTVLIASDNSVIFVNDSQ